MAGLIPEIRTPRLLLRCVEPRDAADFVRLMTPDISRWLGSWATPFTAEMAAEKVRSHQETARSGQSLPYVIINADGALSGWVAIYRKQDSPCRGVLSYWIGTPFHRQGIVAEAAEAALQCGYSRFALDTTEASTRPENAGSSATLRRLGFYPTHMAPLWVEARQQDEVCQHYERPRPLLSGSTS